MTEQQLDLFKFNWTLLYPKVIEIFKTRGLKFYFCCPMLAQIHDVGVTFVYFGNENHPEMQYSCFISNKDLLE